uniref:Uncharacterized protein n=1 Tax=Cyprinus carpio TaxID=7962 RepID=A0A8C1QG89_CYPCA
MCFTCVGSQRSINSSSASSFSGPLQLCNKQTEPSIYTYSFRFTFQFGLAMLFH